MASTDSPTHSATLKLGGLVLAAVALLAPTDAATGQTVEVGSTVTGSVSEKTPSYNNRLVRFYGFQCRPGVSIQVAVNASYDNVAYITNSSGEQVAYNDDGGPGTNALLDWTCPDGGYYQIGAGSYGSGRGEFTLSVMDRGRGRATRTIRVGNTVTGSVTDNSSMFNNRRVQFYRFQCRPDMRIEVAVDADYDNVAYITNSSGEQVAYNDDGGPGVNALIDWTCPDRGSYRIGVGAYSSGRGRFTLSVMGRGRGGVRRTIRVGNTVTGYVTDDSSMFNNRRVEFYRFRCRPGMSIEVAVDADYDNVVYITDSSGVQVGYNDDGGPGVNALLDWTCPDRGSYRIGVGAYSSGRGEFTLTVD